MFHLVVRNRVWCLEAAEGGGGEPKVWNSCISCCRGLTRREDFDVFWCADVSVENILVAEIFDEEVSLGFPVGKLEDIKAFMKIQFVDKNFNPFFGGDFG